jgi:hypothetical protein
MRCPKKEGGGGGSDDEVNCKFEFRSKNGGAELHKDADGDEC